MSLKMFQKILAPYRNRILNLVGRAVISAINDSKSLQRLQLKVNADEVLDDVERVQEYGFASNPKIGAEAVVLFLGGDKSHGLVIATDDRRYRMKVSSGKVAIYDDEGQYVYIKTGGVIEAKANTKVLATCPLFETSGNAKVGGNLEVVGTSTLTGLATATAGVTSPATLTGATIASTGGTPVADLGAKINEIKTAHNTHKHQENGTGGGITNVADVQVT